MRRPMQVPLDFLSKLGPAASSRRGVECWRASQIATAMRCTEQSVNAWARAGRIPPGQVDYGLRLWTMADLKLLASDGIQPIAHYFPLLIANDPIPTTDPPTRSTKARKPKKKGRVK